MVGVLPIRIVQSNVSSIGPSSLFFFLSDEGPMLDYTIRIGSTPTILYFDFYLYSAYAAHYVYFNNLMLLHAHKDLFDKLDLVDVAQQFVSLYSRRLGYFGNYIQNFQHKRMMYSAMFLIYTIDQWYIQFVFRRGIE